MKTAEEWSRNIDEAGSNGSTEAQHGFVRAIQSDALREAAEICNGRITENDFTIEATRCRDAILARVKELEAGK